MGRQVAVLIAAVLLAAGCSKTDDAAKTTPSTATGGATGIKIASPADNATITGNSVTVEYEVKPSSNGDHIHIYVDDRKPDVLRQLKGSYEVTDLTPGTHAIVIKEVNAGHTPTGHDATVHVTVQQE